MSTNDRPAAFTSPLNLLLKKRDELQRYVERCERSSGEEWAARWRAGLGDYDAAIVALSSPVTFHAPLTLGVTCCTGKCDGNGRDPECEYHAPKVQLVQYCIASVTRESEPNPSQFNGEKAYTSGPCGKVMPCDEHPAVPLNDDPDARRWAHEFCKLNGASDESTMLGWFANAIMCGYDHHARSLPPAPDLNAVAEELERDARSRAGGARERRHATPFLAILQRHFAGRS